MSNPWLKKNPFMSMWLSAANRAVGTLRGQATAQARRQVRSAMPGTSPAPKARRKR
jgi:hypothetical protein